MPFPMIFGGSLFSPQSYEDQYITIEGHQKIPKFSKARTNKQQTAWLVWLKSSSQPERSASWWWKALSVSMDIHPLIPIDNRCVSIVIKWAHVDIDIPRLVGRRMDIYRHPSLSYIKLWPTENEQQKHRLLKERSSSKDNTFARDSLSTNRWTIIKK